MSDGAIDQSGPTLFQPERQQEIVAYTLARGRVEVAELSARFSVTPETIRRDLSDLQRRRLLRRVHGGAVPWETGSFEPLLSIRNDHHDEEKRRLADVAIDELPSEGSIIIDSGSTLTRFAEVVPRSSMLRIVTNSLPTAQALSGHDHTDVVMLGGRMRKNTMAMVDAHTVEQVQNLHVDTLFISSDGASAEAGLTTPYQHEAALKRAMIAAARRVVVLVDHSKFGHDHFIRFARWGEIDVVITNHEVSQSIVASLEAGGTTVRLA
ncbi:MAG: DeoR/GlpR family DNA-binding transcription regulator [Actinomycetota bacterium]